MKKYLKLFENHSQYEDFVSGGTMVKPNVSECVQENHVHYNPRTWADEYFTIESLEDNNTIYLKASNSAVTKTISASTDNGTTWTEYTSTSTESGTTLATLNAGDKLLIKGKNTVYGSRSSYNQFKSTKQFEVKGNIMSLVNGDSFVNANELNNIYIFRGVLSQSENLISAENLVLPATTLENFCYYQMFAGCTSLTTAPELPATTLANSCYYHMFYNCTSLTSVPELPATTLAKQCYQGMFRDCTSLTTAPSVLPAETLATACYYDMFYGCTSLTTAPDLPATTLVQSCYHEMFQGCTNLNSITCLATNISASYCTTNWVNGVAASGTFTKAASMTSWTTGVNGIPSGWTFQDAA